MKAQKNISNSAKKTPIFCLYSAWYGPSGEPNQHGDEDCAEMRKG